MKKFIYVSLITIGFFGAIAQLSFVMKRDHTKAISKTVPVPAKHICSDTTHRTCDGLCACDGLACETVRPNAPLVVRKSNGLLLVADETYFKGARNEFDFKIITYNDEIARYLLKIPHTLKIDKKDSSYIISYKGEYYNAVEHLLMSL